MDLTTYRTTFLDFLESNSFDKTPVNLYSPVNYILSIGGKRMRPILTLMATDLFGGDSKASLHAAMAVEVFHNFTLLHDDIMDDAPLRRGKQTVHEKWDVNTAILSGDVMMIKAYGFLMEYKGEVYRALMEVFNQTAIEVCEGQQMDVDFETRSDVSLEEYVEMIKLKTSVLVACALKMGAVIAGASDKDADLIYDFGLNLGLAFQLQDDYLDAFGNPETFGKQVGGDIIENKKTYLYIIAEQRANDGQRADLRDLFSISNAGYDSKIEQVKSIFVDTGADRAILDEIHRYTDKALGVLEHLNLPSESLSNLKDFAHYLMNRSS